MNLPQIQTQQRTSWGSLFAAVGGMIAAVSPFIPAQYQWVPAITGAVVGAIATKLP